MRTIVLDGTSLTREAVCAIARRQARVALDDAGLARVSHAAAFLADQVRRGEPIYGVNTGFGSNADRLLGAHRARDELAPAVAPATAPAAAPAAAPAMAPAMAPAVASVSPAAAHAPIGDGTLMEELQRNLIVTHAVCVGEPLAVEVVRAMLAIRINTLMRGHSGIRVETLRALAALLEHDIVPVVPAKGSVGASGDLAPLSHLAIVLLGGGEAFHRGERVPGAEALARAGLEPIRLSFKEGLALNNGTTQMLAHAVLALDALDALVETADLAAAMTLDAFAGRGGALREEVHALRPHPGQAAAAASLRAKLEGSNLVDIAYHLVPRFRTWCADAWSEPDARALSFDLAWEYVPPAQRHGREAFYTRFLPFRGGKKHQPQDAYSLRCVPQVHGAVRDAIQQAARVVDVELNAVTDNPLVFPDAVGARHIEEQVVSAGHFHGMPIALVMSYVKAAIPVLASISERRLAKLVDPSTNDGLPAFLTGNEDSTDSGFMIVQYTAAALVNDLATRAHPASVYSIPTSANAEDHVSMGANEARHVLEMTEDLGHVLALELYTAAQALDYRRDMLNAARALALRGSGAALAAKIANAPREGQPEHARFLAEVDALRAALADAGEFHAGAAVQRALARIRAEVPFMARDRAMDGDVRRMTALVASRALLAP